MSDAHERYEAALARSNRTLSAWLTAWPSERSDARTAHDAAMDELHAAEVDVAAAELGADRPPLDPSSA